MSTTKPLKNKPGDVPMTSGATAWRSPSNIALVKYWGKRPGQIPQNPSISFTLSKAFSETILSYAPKESASKGIKLEFMFEGKPNVAFGNRITTFLNSILTEFPFLEKLDLKISSTNSFPHSSGIASSASAMSAIALCLCDLEKTIYDPFKSNEAFIRKASHIARLGSGSAARSVFSIASVWGKSDYIEGSSDLYAIPYGDRIHPIFRNFRDSILIASSREKRVSSTAGHNLMNEHIFRTSRLQQAEDNLLAITDAMRSGDLQTFGQIVEEEALTLHALMLTSRPSYVLLEPATLKMIEKIRSFRLDTKIPVYFTLDAGPNIHLLYPEEHNSAVKQFIDDELLSLCEDRYWIDDEAGIGPVKIKK